MAYSATAAGLVTPANSAGRLNDGSVGGITAPRRLGQPQPVRRTDSHLVDLIPLTASMNAAVCLTIFLFGPIPSPRFFALFTLIASVLWLKLKSNISKRRKLKKLPLTGSSKNDGTNHMGCAEGCLSPMKGYCKTPAAKLKNINPDWQLRESKFGGMNLVPASGRES